MAKIISDYRQEDQEQTNWCWAAIAVSIAAYFERGTWKQCAIVRDVTGKTNCCVSPGNCNVMWSVGEALRHAQCLAEHRTSPVAIDTLQRQVDFGNPVVIRLENMEGLAHVSTIVGYGPDQGDLCELTIIDPWRGVEKVRYGNIRNSTYRGSWTDTYFTA